MVSKAVEQFSGDQKVWGSGSGHGLLNEVTVKLAEFRIHGCWMGCHIDTEGAHNGWKCREIHTESQMPKSSMNEGGNDWAIM